MLEAFRRTDLRQRLHYVTNLAEMQCFVEEMRPAGLCLPLPVVIMFVAIWVSYSVAFHSHLAVQRRRLHSNLTLTVLGSGVFLLVLFLADNRKRRCKAGARHHT